MIDAIRQAADAVELRAQFTAQAQKARTDMLQSGLGHDANDVRSYLRQRITNKQADRPDAKPWRK
ncbi:MAG: hypothetical protein H7335_21585 [Massilia sp.]|nr:hypothetical protein [Massilia sp.]